MSGVRVLAMMIDRPSRGPWRLVGAGAGFP